MKKKIALHFLGASGTVTGSKYLVDTGERKILIDCGLFQGLEELQLKNWDYLPIDASKIDTVLLTHGHMDHSGFLPRLVKMGFYGSIQGTRPTLDIAEIIVLDSAKIQEEDAERAKEEDYSGNDPVEPLYDIEDAEKAITLFHRIHEGVWIDLYTDIKVRFQYNGHIIGATFIELEILGKRFVFSGDVGRPTDQLMRAPKKPEKADVLFIESTYGDKIHSKENLQEKLKKIVNDTISRGGTLIIPSFAVERTQTLMYSLWKLMVQKEIPKILMVMDSPMGANVLDVFQNNLEWHEIPIQDVKQMCDSFKIVREFKDTWEVINTTAPKIVIAGSGMVSGGRVLTYLTQYLRKPETTILISGFQAEGTRGRQLLEGATEVIIFGKPYKVEAEVIDLQVLSAHADQSELLDWVSEIKNTPEKVFIVHGEPKPSSVLSDKLKEKYGWDCEIPELYNIKEITIGKE